jgi:EAL domain-containing protein (putative c-di-GMP-specific phosphodiesterase class I)
MHTRAIGRLQLEAELRAALNQRQLRVYYQPIVLLETRQITGFEALVRWDHPIPGLISPARFMEAAQDSGLIASIDQWVIAEACCQTRRWQADDPSFQNLKIAVNISARHFASIRLLDELHAVIRDTKIESSALQLEITDSIAMTDPGLTTEILAGLKRLNITTATDDYGTGIISLSQLRRFDLDLLKIDRSLVINMLANRESRDIVNAILTLGRTWKLEVTAQGIETLQHCEVLKNLGCFVGQGFLFSPPVTAAAATQLLRD